MKSFRRPEYLERYQDVFYDPEQAVNVNPNDGAKQERNGIKIAADNSGETTPFDWYNARFSVDFKVDKLADHAALAVCDVNSTVKGSYSLIKKLSVTANGKEVYENKFANHFVNIKNLLEYNPSYAKSIGTNEYCFLDASRHADGSKYAMVDVR